MLNYHYCTRINFNSSIRLLILTILTSCVYMIIAGPFICVSGTINRTPARKGMLCMMEACVSAKVVKCMINMTQKTKM